MLLGEYYDEVIKEASASNTDDLEQVKIAEAANILDEEGYEFETEKDAMAAIQEVIEEDYAEKVAAVCEQFDCDEIDFDDDHKKVASAMEIVDGWEKIAAVPGTETVKSILKSIKGGAMAGGAKAKGAGKYVKEKAMSGGRKVKGTAKVISEKGKVIGKGAWKHKVPIGAGVGGLGAGYAAGRIKD